MFTTDSVLNSLPLRGRYTKNINRDGGYVNYELSTGKVMLIHNDVDKPEFNSEIVVVDAFERDKVIIVTEWINYSEVTNDMMIKFQQRDEHSEKEQGQLVEQLSSSVNANVVESLKSINTKINSSNPMEKLISHIDDCIAYLQDNKHYDDAHAMFGIRMDCMKILEG